MMQACFEKSSSRGKAHAVPRRRGMGAMVLARRRRKVNNTGSHRDLRFWCQFRSQQTRESQAVERDVTYTPWYLQTPSFPLGSMRT